jgi:hypothetical protein
MYTLIDPNNQQPLTEFEAACNANNLEIVGYAVPALNSNQAFAGYFLLPDTDMNVEMTGVDKHALVLFLNQQLSLVPVQAKVVPIDSDASKTSGWLDFPAASTYSVEPPPSWAHLGQ